MHLLPCPSCQTPIAIAPSQAGEQTKCPSCDLLVAIPTLGQLRKLPQAEPDPSLATGVAAGSEVPLGRRSGFLALGLVAIASLVIAAYCGIRWSQIEVPTTTDEHIALYAEQYPQLAPAMMIREYEDMDRYDISLFQPYKYKKIGLEKQAWGRNALIAGSVAGLSILAALVVIATGRQQRPDAVTDT